MTTRPLARRLAALLLLGATACRGAVPPPTLRWRLAGLYDIAGATALTPGASEAPYAWVDTPEMARTCGATAGPVGLGAPEATLVATARTRALAIVLEGWAFRDRSAPPAADDADPDARPPLVPLSRDDVRLSLRRGDDWIPLEPMVVPRDVHLTVSDLDPDGTVPRRSTVERSIGMVGCLEQLVGRGWVGEGRGDVRRATLQDVTGMPLSDQLPFLGQRAPVPALYGPGRTCLEGATTLSDGTPAGLRPGGLWTARLPPCTGGAVPPAALLSLGPGEGFAPVELVPRKVRVRAVVGVPAGAVACDGSQDGTADGDNIRVCVDGHATGRVIPLRVEDAPKDVGKPDADGTVAGASTAAARPHGSEPDGLYGDVLAQVPYTYPTVDLGWEEPENEQGLYRVLGLLVVPEWQLTVPPPHATDAGDAGAGGATAVDAVEKILEDPRTLSIRVRQEFAAPDPVGASAGRWFEVNLRKNLYEGEVGGALAPLRYGWGYSVEHAEARDPIFVFGPASPSATHAAAVHGSLEQGAVLGALLVCIGLGLRGLRQLSTVVRPRPEVRLGTWMAPPPEEKG